MKKVISLFVALLLCSPVMAKEYCKRYPTDTAMEVYTPNSPPPGGMVYPGAGIPLSTGSAWSSSITNNSANWNTAYGWGNHASAGYLTSSSTLDASKLSGVIDGGTY
jgi:hypothetical protein